MQDEGLIGVDQPPGPDDPTATGGSVATFQAVHRIPPDSLQPGTLISQSAVSTTCSFTSSDQKSANSLARQEIISKFRMGNFA